MRLRERLGFVCRDCGYEAPRWLGRCPACSGWNTMEETRQRAGLRPAAGSAGGGAEPLSIAALDAVECARIQTGMGELDAVLGGGLVAGSLVLLGGDPGIGKSTLLLQLCLGLARAAVAPVLYVTGEESPRQVRLRADRLCPASAAAGGARDGEGRGLPQNLFLLPATSVDEIEEAVGRLCPAFLAVDSIQTVWVPDVDASPGSVVQVREAAGRFLRLAKERGVTTWLVGHINKEGVLAGPKVLEHLVDVVLYLEGERHGMHRLLRSAKNRFGPTSEVAVFSMSAGGLEAVANPSALLLSERASGSPGSAVAAACEGDRAFLVEVQALVCRAAGGVPRRVAQGVDAGRVAVILAVLERRGGLPLGQHDAYVKVAGGFRLEEPAADLAVALAIASSFYDVPVDPGLAVAAEVGLAGELRAVGRVDSRWREAERLGFRSLLVAPGEAGDRVPDAAQGRLPAGGAATRGRLLAGVPAAPSRDAGRTGIVGAGNLVEAMRLALSFPAAAGASRGQVGS